MYAVQVTNRDLSIAVLRRFLPMLERERAISGNKAPRGGGRGGGRGAATREPAAGVDATGPSASSSSARAGGARVLEGLAASGLRSIRYAKEVREAMGDER